MSMIFSLIYGLFSLGSRVGAGLEDLECQKDLRRLPNGMYYYMDRKGALRDTKGRHIAVQNSWDADRLIVEDVASQRIIYDAKTANMQKYKSQLLALNEEFEKKAEENNQRFMVQWRPPFCLGCVIDRETGRNVTFIPVIDPSKPNFEGCNYSCWYAYQSRDKHYCGGHVGCPNNKYDYGTGPRCWACKNKGMFGVDNRGAFSEDAQILILLEEDKKERPERYPGLMRLEDIPYEEMLKDARKIWKLTNQMYHFW